MQHAIINAMKCMRAIKDRIARPVYQLENHLNQPLYTHGVSTGEIIGTTHQSASHNVSFNQVINQSVNQARDVCINISADFTTSITAIHAQADKSAQFVPSTADSTSTDFSQGTETHDLGYQLSPGSFNHGRSYPESQIC
ncbi:Argonaute 5 [Dorcoceras hygrometricum]|uniref:Argonaute 5 n=1 Tax=Dorcoceras hygrometricum TaxID=472368 RepID=A0A2Z7CNL2_9LAMI|nr:Argonaute 5 [Dorcoceras hygrometricum]